MGLPEAAPGGPGGPGGRGRGSARGQEERGGMRPQRIRTPGAVRLQVVGTDHLIWKDLEICEIWEI